MSQNGPSSKNIVNLSQNFWCVRYLRTNGKPSGPYMGVITSDEKMVESLYDDAKRHCRKPTVVQQVGVTL